jgi:IS605 OrfB family transposase
MIRTYKYRIKDASTAKKLMAMARSVNFVWNYCNETSLYAIKNRSTFLSSMDLQKLTAGSSKEIGLPSQTIQMVCQEYATRRKKAKKIKLRWRGKRSLGWIPFNYQTIKIDGDNVYFGGQNFRLFLSRDIPPEFKSGNFSSDARGRWYINIPVEVEEPIQSAAGEVGIDLGLKDLANLSNGQKYKANKYYRKYQRILALSQKDGKKKRIKAIHAKIANSRKDDIHKMSHEVTRDFSLICVGDISSAKLAKTKLAKSIYDASWSFVKSCLEYKSIARGGMAVIVNEHMTTQTCSCCGAMGKAAGAPRGVKGLGIREWVCLKCRSVHDRDTNSALNILRLGRQSLGLK